MLFGKLANPIEFRCRAYEECLSEVVVTHSPRYLIDMNLQKGKTIFDKINTPYDTLRQKENPIKPIVAYYKSKLKPGQDLWWIGQDSDKSSSLVINIWNNLSKVEKQQMKTKAMVYFPELFSNRSDKFARLAIWLVTSEAIVHPNLRDSFTAGGKGNYQIGNKLYQNIPRIFINLFEQLDSVVETLINTPSLELSEYWNIKTNEKEKMEDWLNLVSNHSKTIPSAKHLDVKHMLAEMML